MSNLEIADEIVGFSHPTSSLFANGSLPNAELIVRCPPDDVNSATAASHSGIIPSGNFTVLLDLCSSLGIPLPDKICIS